MPTPEPYPTTRPGIWLAFLLTWFSHMVLILSPQHVVVSPHILASWPNQGVRTKVVELYRSFGNGSAKGHCFYPTCRKWPKVKYHKVYINDFIYIYIYISDISFSQNCETNGGTDNALTSMPCTFLLETYGWWLIGFRGLVNGWIRRCFFGAHVFLRWVLESTRLKCLVLAVG